MQMFDSIYYKLRNGLVRIGSLLFLVFTISINVLLNENPCASQNLAKDLSITSTDFENLNTNKNIPVNEFLF